MEQMTQADAEADRPGLLISWQQVYFAKFCKAVVVGFVFARACLAAAQISFVVSMPQRASHTLHVVFRCEQLTGEMHDFQLPQWSPGFYGIGNYWRYISNFRAEDGAGHDLAWEKVAPNTWRIVAAGAPVVVLSYDVYANASFPANSYVGEDRAYLSPGTMFLHLRGELEHPVSLRIQVPPEWKQISTGLDHDQNLPSALTAPDFNVLYDCPILLGNQERLEFEVGGVAHYVAVENVPVSVHRAKMVADVKKIVSTATALMNDIPYRHYTFLMMGRGAGGIEHANSSSNQFDGTGLSTPAGTYGGSVSSHTSTSIIST